VSSESERAGWLLDRTRIASGIFAAGLVVLAVALIVVWGVASTAGEPGPGPAMLLGHTAAAAAAVALYRMAGSRGGRAGYFTALGPPMILVLLGLLFWWA
jgi:hypothetical protein